SATAARCTLSLHDALPICVVGAARARRRADDPRRRCVIAALLFLASHSRGARGGHARSALARRAARPAPAAPVGAAASGAALRRSEEHTSELQSPYDLVCR